MVQIVSVYNIKGGVGKSTSAVNIAYLAAAAGNRTLIWDLDPQGAASYALRVEPEIEGGVKDIVDGRTELDTLVAKTPYANLDVLPADFSYRRMDTLLDRHKKATKRLLKLMRPRPFTLTQWSGWKGTTKRTGPPSSRASGLPPFS